MTPFINMPKLTAIILILALPFISCYNLDLGTGKSILVKEHPNQTKTKKAVLLENSGNATVDNSLQVSILHYDSKVSDKEQGNTFTVDRDHGKTTLTATSIGFNWISEDTLQIDYDSTFRTFVKNKEVDGVKVLYKAR